MFRFGCSRCASQRRDGSAARRCPGHRWFASRWRARPFRTPTWWLAMGDTKQVRNKEGVPCGLTAVVCGPSPRHASWAQHSMSQSTAVTHEVCQRSSVAHEQTDRHGPHTAGQALPVWPTKHFRSGVAKKPVSALVRSNDVDADMWMAMRVHLSENIR